MNKPLVSILVITYNSSKFVLETLESIKRQTYTNLELVISDDCSKDDTLKVCRDFIASNQDVEFIKNTIIVESSINTGIAPNCNRGVKASSGEWMKLIAGDDILIDECIEEYVKEVSTKEEKIFGAGIQPFSSSGNHSPIRLIAKMLNGNVSKQLYTMLLYGIAPHGSTLFVEKKTLLKLNCFSENYPMVEDYPIFIKFVQNGYRIGGVDKLLVRYRCYDDSISHQLRSPNHNKMLLGLQQHAKTEIIPNLLKWKFYDLWWHRKIELLVRKNCNLLWKRPLGYLLKSIDPVAWKMAYLKKIKKQRMHPTYICS